MTPEKIVILGSGMAALTAAFELTTPDNWQDNYEITVYQMGWRLGGKGASGRNAAKQNRIEEHGLHIWFGFYENAFNVLYRAYLDLDRPPKAAYPTVQSGFIPISTSVLMENINTEWKPWSITFPTNPQFPGIPNHSGQVTEFPSIWSYMIMVLEVLHDIFEKSIAPVSLDLESPQSIKPPWWEKFAEGKVTETEHAFEAHLLKYALEFSRALPSNAGDHRIHDHNILGWLLHRFRAWVCKHLAHFSEHSDEARHAALMLDLGTTIVIGCLEDGVLTHGFNAINRWDYSEWLDKNGACDFLLKSVLVHGVYDLLFGYVNGDLSQPNIEVGNLLRAFSRMFFTYKGAIMFEMNAGMGDIVIAPIYLALKQRGVKFKFFHRVTDVIPDGDSIAEIQFARQVDLSVDEYDPLVLVNDLPCFPSDPNYTQLVQGEELKRRHVNLESRWADWQDVGAVSLKQGLDFDRVILGISLAALPDSCGSIFKENATWRSMATNMKTTQTQAVQVWFRDTLTEMGWTQPSFSLSGYVEPLSSWGDFSQVISQENYPLSAQAKTVLYGTGVLQDDFVMLPPPSDHKFPVQASETVKGNLDTFFEKETKGVLPAVSDDQGTLDWRVLVDVNNQKGETRLMDQYWRANIDPTERYVLSVADSDQYRLKTDESGYSNLYLTGTWINNGFNLSSIEAAVMAGMQTSRAICGYPQTIVGEVTDDQAN